jgi:HlyD family secretion protein
MKAMNFETTRWRRQALEGAVLDEDTLARRRRRRNIILVFLAMLAIAITAFLVMTGGRDDKAAAPAGGEEAQTAPAVSVIVPGRQQIPGMVSTTGALAARRDLPVGVPGEGGQVARVLVEPGQWVRAGQTLAVIDRSVQSQEAQQLAAQIDVARADLRLAQNELERAEALVSRGFISTADLDRKRATRDAAAARVRVAQAQLGGNQARIGRLDVRAPAAGLVLDRNVEAGQVVGPGSGALFRIAQGGEMEMVARLPQQDLARMRAGLPASVTPVGSEQAFGGQIWQVSPVIDPQTRQGEVRISIPYNPLLRPGGFASAQILSGAMDAPLLPESAVLTDDQGTYVYVVTANDTVERRPVRVATVIDQGVVIAEGLAGNERIVRSAGVFLNPGERVRPELARR